MCSNRGLLTCTTLAVFVCVLTLCTTAKTIEISRIKRNTDNNNCMSIRKQLNITLNPTSLNKGGGVCGGECCDVDAENGLRYRSQQDFASLLRHKTQTVHGMLSFTAATLQSQVMELSSQSENKTRLLFSQVYKGMAVLSSGPVTALYTDIRNYIERPHPDTSIDIRASVLQFFADLFPLVYHRIVLNSNDNKDFAPEYKLCLKKTVEIILPFGDVPKQTSQALLKSLEVTRLLLHSFHIGVDVLNATDRLLIDENAKSNFECHNALLKMTYCPKCNGVTSRPCVGYCYNVLRGCLTKYVAELDAPWNGYVEGVESLINAMKKSTSADGGLNIDVVFKSLDSKISDAIMRAMQNGQDILTKVKRNCGPADLSKTTLLLTETPTSIPPTPNPRYGSHYETKVFSFLTDFIKTRGFYGNLADTLCRDENFAEKNCWNGERVGEYTKMVVDVGLDMQKYNPEVKPQPNTQINDPKVAELVDKLRHVHHMAVASSGTDAEHMQRDQDGVHVDGSGSGDGMGGDDDFMRGSGSGHGSDERSYNTESPSEPTVITTTGGASTVTASLIMFMLSFVVFCTNLDVLY